jgi:hypothetical protein
MSKQNNGLYLDAAHRLLNPFRRDLEPTRGDTGFARFKVRGVDRKSRTVTAAVSTANRDRHGEVVLPEAVEESIPRFMENPALLAGHKHVGEGGEPTTIGHWIDLHRERDAIIGTARFMDNDELAEKYWQRYLQKAQRAFSIGFIGLAAEMRTVKNGNGPERVRHWTELELLEISAVSCPSNRESLVRGALATVDAALTLDDAGDDLGGLSNRRLNKKLERAIPSTVAKQIERLEKDIGYMLEPVPGSALDILIEETIQAAALATVNVLLERLSPPNSSRAKGAPSPVRRIEDWEVSEYYLRDHSVGGDAGGADTADASTARTADADDLDALLAG